MVLVTTPQRKGGRAWGALRATILKASPYCAIRGPRCAGWATTVDHVVPVALGGAELDPSNCRPACARCNYAGGARITNARRAGRPLVVRPQQLEHHSRRWCTGDNCSCQKWKEQGDFGNRY